MASVTRSNRRTEGLHQTHLAHHHLNLHGHNQQHHLTRAAKPPAVELYASNEARAKGRQKRTLESADRNTGALKPKKTRIAVEILTLQQQSPMQGVCANVQFPLVPRPTPVVPAPALSLSNTTPNKTAPTRSTISSPHRPPPIAPAAAPHHAHPGGGKPADEEPVSTKRQSKVINGLRAELDRLQPKPAAVREPGRKLRSHEATRFKSELGAYFPDYDEVIGNDPKEKHLLNHDTPIVVLDSSVWRTTPDIQLVGARVQQQTRSSLDTPVRGYGDSLFMDVCDSQRIDFKFLETQQNSQSLDDPLPDSLFEPSHRRAERLEKSIRNTEKGRAQHEKDQIARLLEGLQGHDWLRIMGVSGVTETKKRSFEPARMHFIKGCQGILEKFRLWNLEEKRRKLEKEKATQAEHQAALEQEQEQQHEQRRRPRSEIGDSEYEDLAQETCSQTTSETDEASMEVIEDSAEVVTSQSDTSDATPAKQLHQEALARSYLAAVNPKKTRALHGPGVLRSGDAPREFTSFFSKKYERDSALNRTRRTGRKMLAWGHPVPDMHEADFALPEAFRDEERLRLRARKKRRDKRHSRP